MQQTMATTTHWGAKLKTPLDASVGFDSIQEQLRLKSLKRGFEFNIMVVGKDLYHAYYHCIGSYACFHSAISTLCVPLINL